LIYACLQVLVKIREKPESRTTSGSFAKDAEKEINKRYSHNNQKQQDW
jgi:hypothetical protein